MRLNIDPTEQLVGEATNAVEDAKERGILEPVKEVGKYLYEKATGSGDEGAKTRRRPQESAIQKVKKTLGFKKGGSISSASKRADGIAQRGKTKGRIV